MLSAVLRRLPLGLLVLCSLAASARAADPVPTDRLLPPNVLAYVSVADITRLRTQLAETSFGQMVQDPALADVRVELLKRFADASKKVEAEIGMPIGDLLAIPTGEVAFAVLQPPREKIGMVLFLDVGEHQDLLDKLLDKAEDEIKKQGKLTRSSDEFEGTEITIWTDEDADVRNPFPQVVYAVKDSMFLIGSSAKVLEDALIRWDGKHDRTFATQPTYKYILDRCAIEGQDQSALTWYIDPIGVFKAGMASAGPEAGMSGAMALGFLPILGLDRLKGAGGTTGIATGDYEFLSQSLIYVDQPVTGVLRAMVCPPVDQTPPAFLPVEISNLSGLNWDVPGALNAVEQVWDFFTSTGAFAKTLDDLARNPDGPGLHVKDDFFNLLSGQVYLIQEMTAGEDAPQQQICFLLGLRDEARMQEVTAKLGQLPGVKARDYRGIKIYESESTSPDQPTRPAAAVAHGYLILDMQVEHLESLLQEGDNAPLAKSKDYQLVRKEFPDTVSTFSFQRQDQVMEVLYKAMRQGLADQDDFDVDLLPDFEVLRKYFGLAGSYSIPDENGVFMSSFSFPRE